jgi:Regulator of chromosome condensation (RCC1) repeat
MTGVVGVALGSEHALALLGDGTVRAWGLNSSGQLGVGQTGGSAFAPVSPLISNVALPGGCVPPAGAAVTRSAVTRQAPAGHGPAGSMSALPRAVPHPVPVPARPVVIADPAAQSARRQALARDVRLAPGGASAAGAR